jgi:hypothetical protein
MPKAHQKYLDRTPSSLLEEATRIGPSTARLVEAILSTKRHPEMGYRSCLGILGLAKVYPAERVEAAARRALQARAYNCQSMESILRNQLDRLPVPGNSPVPPSPEHENIRGARLLRCPLRNRSADRSLTTPIKEKKAMLNQQTIEKLYAMRMRGMADAFTRQQEEPQNSQLSFEERFAMLVDRQWNWRQNRALGRRLKEGRLQGAACFEDIDFRAARGLDKQVVRALIQDSAWVERHQHIFWWARPGLERRF